MTVRTWSILQIDYDTTSFTCYSIFYYFEKENKDISIFWIYTIIIYTIFIKQWISRYTHGICSVCLVRCCAFQRFRADGEGTVRTARWCRVLAATWSARESRRSRTETRRLPANAFAVRRCPGARVSRDPTCTWRGTSASSIWRRKLLTVGRIHSICKYTVIYGGAIRVLCGGTIMRVKVH